MTRLSPADILGRIEKGIKPWCDAHRVKPSLATDSWNVLELLAQSPSGLRVILHWNGDDDAGGHESAGIVDNVVEVIVSHNRGLLAAPGANLVHGIAGQPPLYTTLSDLRAVLRSLTWPDGIASKRLFYKGTKPVTAPDGLPLDAMKMTFGLVAGIPAVADQAVE